MKNSFITKLDFVIFNITQNNAKKFLTMKLRKNLNRNNLESVSSQKRTVHGRQITWDVSNANEALANLPIRPTSTFVLEDFDTRTEHWARERNITFRSPHNTSFDEIPSQISLKYRDQRIH